MATTLSAVNVERFVPRTLHEGVYAQTFKFEYAGSVSVSDVLVIGYIAQGVQVLDGWAWGSEVGVGAQPTYKFGVGGTDNNLSTAIGITATGITRLAGFVPKQFSLSADAEGNLKMQVIATKATGSSTVSGSVNLTLLLMNNPT